MLYFESFLLFGQNDTHKYYNSSYMLHGEYLWVDLDLHPEAVKHELLSDAHRRAAVRIILFSIQLPIPFI